MPFTTKVTVRITGDPRVGVEPAVVLFDLPIKFTSVEERSAIRYILTDAFVAVFDSNDCQVCFDDDPPRNANVA